MAMERNVTPDGARTEYHKFVLTSVDNNNNKFWNVGLYDSNDVEIEFGRVGVTKTQGVHRCVGSRKMNTLIRSKENKGYRELETLDGDFGNTNNSSIKVVAKSRLKNIAIDQITHSSPETKKLIEWLADVNRHQISSATDGKVSWNADTGLFQTELGIVTPNSITKARNLLVGIGDYVAKNDYSNHSFAQRVSDYLMFIPQNVGMRLNLESFLPNIKAVQKQNDILDALDASYVSATTMPQDDKEAKKVKKEKKIFETKLILVNDGKTHDRINKFYNATRNRMHTSYNLKIRKIWEVEIDAVQKAFEVMAKKISNVQELFHGSKAFSVLAILKAGLIIPPSSSAHVTGRLFGDGIYAASASSKALNYATSYWGGNDPGRYFMFILDMAMGKMFIPKSQGSRYYGSTRFPVPNYDSTFAKGGQSGIINDEMIVYKTSQVNLKYLIEFSK